MRERQPNVNSRVREVNRQVTPASSRESYVYVVTDQV